MRAVADSPSPGIEDASGERGAGLITVALPTVGMGGAEIVNVALAKQFLNKGFHVDLVTLSLGPHPTIPLPVGVRQVVLHSRRTRDFLLPFVRYLRSARPDAAIASMWPFTTACVLAHRLARSAARIVVCDHCTLSNQYKEEGLVHWLALKSSIGLTYPLAHARVAVSVGLADDLAALSGILRDTISVIYNPLLARPETPSDAAAAETIWGGWRGPRIITVGRFKAQKNHPLLIRAFKKLLETQDARLLILGTGELVEITKAVARAEGVADKVLMPGMVSNPTPYYRSSDLFALSSDYEGFGNVIVEALSCGVPVVSTNCRSGPSEILANGRYGRLVPVGDAGALALAMGDALATNHDREELKRRAADFAVEPIAEQYLKLLFPKAANGHAAGPMRGVG
jgi:glycosyltransferase involved in cell wall biosynthesis